MANIDVVKEVPDKMAVDNDKDMSDQGEIVLVTSVVLSAEMESEEADRKPWILDSGASTHMVCEKDWFTTFENASLAIKTASGEMLPGKGIARVKIGSRVVRL